MKIDKKLIKELVDNLDEFKLTELEYQSGETKIKVSKASTTSIASKISDNVISNNNAVLNQSEEDILIISPFIGRSYLAP